MNSDDNTTNLPAASQPVGDLNVERLLGNAYKPETPDPEFVRRVEASMCSAARERAEVRAVEQPRVTLARRPAYQWSKLAWSAVAATILVGAGFVVGRQMGRPAGDGLAMRPADSGETLDSLFKQPVPPMVTDAKFLTYQYDPQEARGDVLVGDRGLTPRPRPPAPATELLAIGSELRTEASQRRRVELGDGSVLFLNENTHVAVTAERQLALNTGEIYVEVSPRLSTHDSETEANEDNEGASGKRSATFVVKTAGREIAALGTKFAVRADSEKADVLVTQGKVQVNDIAQPIAAGQQFAVPKNLADLGQDMSGPTVLPLPRASHVLDWTRDLVAAAESPLVPASEHAGGSIVARDPNGQEARLSLRKYHVDVHIEDGFARTTIDQTYFNHTSWRLEGTFHFPLPPDASLSRLAMYVEGKLMEGGMAERNYAREVFEKIVRTQKDPALLEWVDGSTFKMRVFPLEARQEKRIILSYTQRLDTLYGASKYRFPAGHSLEAVRDWSFHARVKRGAELTWSCDSHELKDSRDGNDLILDGAAKEAKLDRDIVLRLTDRSDEFRRPLTPNPSPPKRGEGSAPTAPNRQTTSSLSPSAGRGAGGEGSARFSSTIHDRQRYVMLRFRPDLPTKTARQRRDWVFLFESSGDRDTVLARVQVDVIKGLLQNAEHDDTFAILTAGTQVRTFSKEPLPAAPDNVKKAIEFLDSVHLVGALDLGQALAAADPFVKTAKNAYIVHVGSGMPVLGERAEDKLLKRIPAGARYVGVGVGKRWSRQFMKTAASRSGGYFTQINPDEPVAWRAFDLYSTLNTPRLLNASVVDHAERATFLIYNDSIAHGEELCAIARLGANESLPENITVSGTLDTEPFRRVIPVEDISDKADYLPRTWAKLRIDQLLADDAAKHKDEIISLSKAMYVMSPFTSLLVLENEQMYVQFNIDRGRKDHWAMYDCPAQIPVVHEPLPQTPVAAAVSGAERGETKASASEILSTIVVRLPFRGRDSSDTTSYYSLGQQYLSLFASPNDESGRAGAVSMNIGQVEVQGLDQLGVIITRGNPQDVENMKDILSELETVSQGTSSPLAEYRRNLAREEFNRYRFAVPSQAVETKNGFRSGKFDKSLGVRLYDADGETASKQLQQFFAPSNRGDGIVVPGEFDFYSKAFRASAGADAADYAMQNGVLPYFYEIPERLSQTPSFGGGFGYYPRNGVKFIRDGLANTISMGEVAGGGLVPGRWSNPDPWFSALHFSDDYDHGRPWGIDQSWGVARSNQWHDRSFPAGDFYLRAFQHVTQEDINDRLVSNLNEFREGLGRMPGRNPAGRGRPRNLGIGPADGGGIKRSDRWQINLSAGQSDAEYARMLDHFGVELGAVVDKKMYLVSRLSSPTPLVRVMDRGPSDNRLYFSWRSGSRRQSDLNLLRRAGVPQSNSMVVLQYYPVELEQLLAKLERDFLRSQSGNTDLRLVRRTVFEARPAGTQLGVAVARQEYFGTSQAASAKSSGGVAVTVPRRPADASGVLAASFVASAGNPQTLIYQRPTFSGDSRVFTDLLAYAPGAATTMADVFAILEAETGAGETAKRGEIEPDAKTMIDRARESGWQVVTLPSRDPGQELKVRFDGTARFEYERVTAAGLRERVNSDGTTLWHVYPELGIAMKRVGSRFHRAEIQSLVPWLLSPAEELARGGDVKLLDERTVAVVPVGAQDAKDEDGEPVGYGCMQLLFASDGRLAERRWLAMPAGTVLARETYAADGTMKLFNGDGKVLVDSKLAIEPARQPELVPDTNSLVVLEMPVRTVEHIYASTQRQRNGQYLQWSENDAMKLLAASLTQDPRAVTQIIGQRFFAQGDRRIGFYTLLMASGLTWDPQGDQVMAAGSHVRFDPVADHPNSTLAKYVFLHQQQMTKSGKIDEMDVATGPGKGFIEQLAAFRDLHVRWSGGKVIQGGLIDQDQERKRAVEFVRPSRSPLFGWAVLAMVQNQSSGVEWNRTLAEIYRKFEQTPGLEYAARYERAYCVYQTGEGQLAKEMFRDLYAETLQRGVVPPVDQRFRQAFQDGTTGPAMWAALWRDAAEKVIEADDRPAAMAMASQCHKLGDTAMADELFATSMRGAAEDERPAITLAAINYLAQTEQYARADELLQPLLNDERFGRLAWLWRLGASLAEKHGMTARSVACLDRAMDIEYSQLPDEVDLESTRAAFGSLLDRYQKLADSIASLQSEPPQQLIQRVIRAADRWRSLDPEDTAASQAAARILRRLGAGEAAWEYVTMPLADRPGEAPQWSNVAATLRGQNELELADRAYRAATDAEPTNARIVWDYAQMLEQHGNGAAAHQLYRRLADGQWAAEFQSIQEQARKYTAAP